MIKGSSIHRGAEFNWSQKIESMADLKKNDIIDMSVNEFDKMSSEDLFISDEEKTIGKDNLIGKAKDSVVSLTGIYADEMAPTIQPVKCEMELTQNIAGVDVLAYIDLIDDKNNIRDMKVTGKSKTQNDVDTSSQLTLYSMMLKDFSGELIIDNLVDTKTPKYNILTTRRNDIDYFRLIRTIEMMTKAVQSGIFLPPAEGSWVCNKKFCGYHGICEYTKPFKF
jgi:hypothetical protein